MRSEMTSRKAPFGDTLNRRRNSRSNSTSSVEKSNIAGMRYQRGFHGCSKDERLENPDMNEREKLQRAVEATIAAGYQLNSEAFDLLSTVAATEDPTTIVSKALQRMEELEEKPLFIDKVFLETLLKQPEIIEEKDVQPQAKNSEPPEHQMTEGKSVFHPYAKDVEADISIIEDPTGKLSSNGTIEEYLQYFQDRFKRIERTGDILRLFRWN